MRGSRRGSSPAGRAAARRRVSLDALAAFLFSTLCMRPRATAGPSNGRSAIAAYLASTFLGLSLFAAGASAQEPAPRPAPAVAAPTAGAATDRSPEEFEERMDAALVAAEAALASEEARLDELAARNSRLALPDGRPSLGQAAANIRLWDRRIRDLETVERELDDELNGVLTSLGPDLVSLVERLSAQWKQAERKEEARLAAAAHRERERLAEARRADDAAYARARSADMMESYEEYLKQYPNGRHAAESRSRLAALRKPKGPAVGQRFRDCEECPEMVVVPAGSFQMGSPDSEEDRRRNEGPVRRVTIPKSFAVGVYEVKFFEWDACRRSGFCGHTPEDRGWGRGNRPVINVNWEDARDYVGWLSGKTGKEYRLLSESEWEYVARAGTRTPYHFGSTIPRVQANFGRLATVPVGSYPANDFGLHDVSGNVQEWVEDCWHENYAGAPSDGRAWTSGGDCSRTVARGGSWGSGPAYRRSASRGGYEVVFRASYLGFRVARTLD